MNAKLTGLLAITAAGWAAAQSVADRQADLERRIDAALSQRGISIGGAFRGQYASSEFGGASLDDSVRRTEAFGFTSVDFDLRARPNTAAQVRALFRMHLDWPNFWSSPYTPFETRWVSLDGSMQQDMIRYSIGSLSERWSPYTIWAPEPAIVFQPRIFEQQQRAAMAERFLGGNRRNIPGARLTFRAAVPSVSIDSFMVSGLLSKLATGENPTDKPPIWAPFLVDTSQMDRVVWGFNADIHALKGLRLGASLLVDQKLASTYYQAARFTPEPATPTARWNAYQAWQVTRDTLLDNGSVMGFRGGVDVHRFMAMGPVTARLSAELGVSNWDVFRGRIDTSWADQDATRDSVVRNVQHEELTGSGLNVELNVGLNLSPARLNLMVGYIMNDSAWRNDLAQSPIVYRGRIYNTDQDRSAWFSNYTLFDNLYHYRHRFVPETDANSYVKNPVEKIAWTNVVTTPASRRGRVLRELWTGGEAAANRVGPKVRLNAEVLDGAVQFMGSTFLLQEAAAVLRDTLANNPVKTDRYRYQAGLRVRGDAFLGDAWNLPLEVSASWEQNGLDAVNNQKVSNTLLSTGAYLGLVRRLSLMAGWQQLVTEQTTQGDLYGATQSNVALGLEFKVTEGAYLVGRWNVIGVDYNDGDGDDFTQDIMDASIRVQF